MSHDAHAGDGHSTKKKTLGEKVGGALGAVLIIAIFFIILGPLIGIMMDGLNSVLAAIGQGAQNATSVLTNVYVDIQRLTMKLLMIAFNILVFIALGAFIFFIFGKIMDEIKKIKGKGGGTSGHDAGHH